MSDNPFSFDSESDSPNPFALDGEEKAAQGRPLSPMENPYTPTTDVSSLDRVGNSDEQTRHQYLSHEASIRSLGLLYLIPGVLFLVGAMLTLGFGVVGLIAGDADSIGPLTIVVLLYGGLGALYLFTGRGLQKLQKPARVIASIFSALGLLAVPIGTLISAYFLYLLLSEKGNVVFSPEYSEVIARTPHIKYKTSIVAKVILGVFLLAILTLVVSLAFTG